MRRGRFRVRFIAMCRISPTLDMAHWRNYEMTLDITVTFLVFVILLLLQSEISP